MKTENATPAADTPSGPIETRRRADLKPHPRHSAIFHGLSGQRSRARVDDLIEDIRQRGLVRPVEVTVRDVVMDGHLRIEALRRLGRDEVAVQVRRDLGRDRAAIDRRHLQVNADPSRFDQLERVCLAVRAFEIERGLGYGELPPADRCELHTRLAEALGTSGRTAADYIAIAAAPRRVQEPFVMGRSSRAWAVSQARSLIASGVVIPATVPRGVTPPEVAAAPPPRPTRDAAPAEVAAAPPPRPARDAAPAEVAAAPLPRPVPPRIDRSEAQNGLIASLDEGMVTIFGPGQRIRCGLIDPEHGIRVLGQFSEFGRELKELLERMPPAIR
jgi:hypothetical protein